MFHGVYNIVGSVKYITKRNNMIVTKAMISEFYRVSIDIEYGNWSDAAATCVDNGFDVFTLFDISDKIIDDTEVKPISDRDLAIISVYAERLRYDRL